MTSPEYWSRLLIALSTVGAVVATLFYLLRLYSQCLGTGKLDASDVFLGFGLVLSYGITIPTVIAQEFWPASQVCIKLSIIMLLRRLLGSVTRVLSLTLFLAVFILAWGLATLVANTFQCWPPQYFWNQETGGRCISGEKALFIATGAVSFVQDIVLLAIPFAIVWRLQMEPRKKALLTILFGIGGIVCILSLMRLIEFRYYPTKNLTASGTRERIWTVLEIDIAIVCASVILMPPLFKRCTHTCWKTYHQITSRLTTTECTQVESWPFQKHCTNFSQDGRSEVRSQAYPASATEVRDRRAEMAGGCIRVETTISRDIDDREVLWPQAGSSSLTSGIQATLAGNKRLADDMSNVDFSGVGWDATYP
ncbi:hypothetical protein BDV24DRAFT_178242 [Aspergillus arachidicola]|uniref:Rhodopsin domain-containing protein n=1 Tax=Aspergillus arachidicola TaxID=656916 RepID=A0A5N6YPP2_9EURO|nr:hypothetical protein BDV24DRAFT_178242 [Aspergillus arachidicola]